MQVYVQHLGDQVRSSLVTAMEGERWRRATVAGPALASWHPAIRDTFTLDTDTGDLGQIRVTSGDTFVFVQSVVTLLSSISDYCKLADQIPQVKRNRFMPSSCYNVHCSPGQHRDRH